MMKIIKASEILDKETIVKVKLVKSYGWQELWVRDEKGRVLIYETNKKGAGE